MVSSRQVQRIAAGGQRAEAVDYSSVVERSLFEGVGVLQGGLVIRAVQDLELERASLGERQGPKAYDQD